MEFCPKCGAMMLLVNDILKCNSCGYSDKTGNAEDYKGITIDGHEPEETVKIIYGSYEDKIVVDTSINFPRRFKKIDK